MDSNPQPSSVLFARGVIARLEIWSTMRIAVQEGWGGHGAAQKRTWLASAIVDTFEETTPTPDDQHIEELLLQVMADEFDVVIEDGSAEGVAKDIVGMWEETAVGNGSLVVKFEGLADGMKGKRVEAQVVEGDGSDGGSDDEWEDDDEDDDGDGEDEEEVPQLFQHPESPATRNEPEIDEDGFTLVKGKGKNRR